MAVPQSWPDVTAFPLDEAVSVLGRAGAEVVLRYGFATVAALPEPPRGGLLPGRGEWRVVRQRALGGRTVELLLAWRVAEPALRGPDAGGAGDQGQRSPGPGRGAQGGGRGGEPGPVAAPPEDSFNAAGIADPLDRGSWSMGGE
ncbi:MAG: hypothetical protein K6T75_11805 [Acetobacteraceae bacterium]|nr:hypothetical protein [Acetobacteraceae bacterium]